jgi:uncharacterized membrane protein
MISLPPVITTDNIAYATGFFPIKDKVKALTLSIIKKECYLEFDNKGFASMQKYMAAMLFGQLLFSRVNSPYTSITLDEYKEQINYDEYKKCFSCTGINIDDIVNNFGYDDP